MARSPRSLSAATARPSPHRATIARDDSGTPRPARPWDGRCAIRPRSRAWRLARTAKPWPPAAMIRPPGSGIVAAASLLGMQLSNDGAVYAAAFSPDGRMVLTGCADNAARLWEATTGQPIGKPMVHPDDVRAVAFSPDGKSILTGCDDSRAGCGTRPPANCVTPRSGILVRCRPLRFAPTARRLSPAVSTRRHGCGMRRPASPSVSR